MAKVKAAISIESELLEKASDIAHELGISRSKVLSQALTDFIQRYQSNKLLEAVNAAFDDEPDKDEGQIMKAMREKQKKLWEEDAG